MKRFSLLSLLIGVTLCALVYSAWDRYRQTLVIRQQNSRLDELRTDCRSLALLAIALTQLNPSEDRDSDALMILRDFAQTLPIKNLIDANAHSIDANVRQLLIAFGPHPQLVDVGTKPGELEILSLCRPGFTIPGESSSVNLLFSNENLIDVIARRTGTRAESHTIEIRNINSDCRAELIIRRSPGILATDQMEDLIFEATPTGFRQLE